MASKGVRSACSHRACRTFPLVSFHVNFDERKTHRAKAEVGRG